MIRKAVIDLGTNTFNLLIADVTEHHFDKVFTTKEGVALGMGGIHQNLISIDAFERGIQTILHFHEICQQYQVQKITAIGTSALRDATNQQDFIDQVHQKTGIQIEIVSGLEEAQLIYQGVQWLYHFEKPGVIMDIGGGSTEFIFASHFGVQDVISLNIGVSRIFQIHQFSDPMSLDDVTFIEQYLEENANGFFDDKSIDMLIGASGSFETFYELMHTDAYPHEDHCIELPITDFDPMLQEIIFSTAEEREKNPWIIPIRKKMAPIAAVKVNWIMKKLNIKKVLVCPFSLKEGVLKT